MKKTLLIACLLLALCPLPLMGQKDTLGVQGFLRGWSVGVAGGGNSFFYYGSRGFRGQVKPDAEILVGKAFSPYAGVRLGYERGGMSYTPSRASISYAYIHGDVLWDLSQTFGGLSAQRRWSVAPYMHFGLLGLLDGGHLVEREYASGAGVVGSWRILPMLSATLDVRTSLYTGAVSRGDGHLGSLAVLGGLRWDIDGADRWQLQRGGQVQNGFGANWFLTLQGGVNTIGLVSNYRPSGATAALDLGVGKWLTPAFGLRLGGQGLQFSGLSGTRFNFAYIHGDVLWNILPYKAESRWSTGPYLHMGALMEKHLNGGSMGRFYAGGIGWFTGVRLTRRLGLHAEIRGLALNSGTAGDASSSGLVMSWNALAGLNYRLGVTDWRALPAGPASSYEGLKPLRKDVGRLSRRAMAAHLRPRPDRHALKKAGEPYRIGRFRDNWSAQLSVGTTEGALAADLSVTKWVLPQVGGRLGYQGLSLSGKANTVGFAYLHQDLLLNAVDLLAGYKPQRRWRMVPYLHFGVISEYDGSAIPLQVRNFEYAGGVGLMGSFMLDRHLGLTAEYRTTLLTSDVSLTGGMRAASTVLLGLEYSFGPRGWKALGSERSGGLRMGRFADNWFLSGALGVNGFTDVHGAQTLAGLGADLTLGKWVTPQFGLRGGVQGIRTARLGADPRPGVWSVEQADGRFREQLGFVYVHGDFLWNLSQTVLPYKEDRLLSVVPYAHMGALVEYGVEGAPHRMFERELAAGVGLMNSFRLNQDVDLYLDARMSVLRSEASGDYRSGAGILPSVLVGVSGRLGPQGFARDAARADVPEAKTRPDRARWAFSLNLGDAALLGTMGLSAQWAPARHWSVESALRVNPFSYRDHTLFDLRQSFSAGARWWPWHVYSGWFVRAAAQVESMRRNGLEPLSPNFSGESYGLSLGGGYALMLSSHFNLEFGLGAFGGRRRPHSEPANYYWFVAPDTLLLSLVWVL